MDVNRYLFDADERRKNETSNVKSESVINPFFKGVVTHVLFDERSPDTQGFYGIARQVEPSIQEFRIPKNSLIARVVDGGADSLGSETGTNSVIAYPFFSSHLCLPVKEGETVWIMFDTDSRNKGYWISRVSGDEFSEDLNFSHFDRSQAIIPNVPEISKGPGTYERSTGSPNNFEESQSINPPEDGDFPNISLDINSDGYQQIFSRINRDINRLEPVPRYKKRPGDLVLQGSNNALIALTTDRGWNPSQNLEEEESNVNSTVNPFSGTIDIVAGRSRKISDENERGNRTVPNVYQNERGYEEIVKERYQGDPTPAEGDPDFLDDAARIYVSSKTSIDESFELESKTPNFPGENQPNIPEPEHSAIALKADEIRIIARKDESAGINGSITIVKEGDFSNDNCSIRLQPDGSILISGTKIFIGRSSENDGSSEGPSDAPGNSQPYVKYKQLETLLENIINDVNAFCDTMVTHVTPDFGAPSPQITAAATELKAKMLQRKTQIPSIKSKRIFGE